MDVLTQQVLKEPKGAIRVLQFVFAFLAMYTTSSFSTSTSFNISCFNKDTVTITYPVEYPFNFQDQVIFANRSCEKSTSLISYKFPMDFSSSPQFYVTVGVLSMLYSAGALVCYSYGMQRYRENALLPVLDLIGTSILSLFWLAGTCAWSAGVSDVKYYVHPAILKEHVRICKDGGNDVCTAVSIGKWAGLNISVIFGFGCVLLWGASIWFVYKETQFFKQQQQQRELMQQQQYGVGVGATGVSGVAVQNQAIPSQPVGANPFGNYDPIGQPPAPTNPYIQQNQYSGY